MEQHDLLIQAGKTAGKSLNLFCVDALVAAANRALNQDPLCLGSSKPLHIRRFLRTGELGEPYPADMADLYMDLGDLLNKSEFHEVFGTIVFEGEDDKFYVATVEGCVGECAPDYLKQVRDEVGE
jgi:hypothetical protein